GLLVAHQCSQPRHWQEYEISWFSQIAIHVGFALDHAKIIERNIQEYELNRSVSLSQRIFLSQQEELRQVVVELIQDNQGLFTALSTQAQNLSKTLVASLKRIQKVFDTAKSLKSTTEQVEKQVQLNSRLLGEGRKNLKSTLESISVSQETSTDGGIKLKSLKQHCQQLSEVMNNLAICLGEPTNSQTIVESYLENSQTETVTLDTEEMHRLKEQLCAVIGETQPLLTSAIASIDDIIEIGTQQKSAWVQSLQTTEEKLDSVITANMEMAKLVDNMAQIVTNQAQISNEAGQHVVAASKIVHKILEQSQTLTKWFVRLLTFCQENMQKIMFWENIKGFLRSSRTLVTFFASKD
ncbi:hypothetical protein, partial [Calothrix rhizosoleniae]|uniref:hypothetical protein n=1 Tax=Calothrix rhizosoleniae TaxID=888997 RepID=UPI0013563FBE